MVQLRRLTGSEYTYKPYYVQTYAYIDGIENMDYGIFQTCLNNFVRNSENLQNPVLQSDSFLIFVVFDNYL